MMRNHYFLQLHLLVIFFALTFCRLLAHADSSNVSPAAERAEAVGAEVATKVFAAFLAPLTTAVEEKGVPEAMSFCSMHAAGLTDAVSGTVPEGVATFSPVYA
jgi:hypothetical protein